jgi:ubiquinol-cytochrome c reductase cytochrome c subunit
VTDDFDGELGFEPAVPAGGAEPAPAASEGSARPRRRRPLRHKLAAAAVLTGALGAMGGAYAAFAASSGAANTPSSAQQIAEGRQIFQNSCITCHGANLQGVTGRGPTLLGVGGAAAYFQVSTGRMPLAQQDAEANRKPPMFNEAQTQAIAAYIQSVGGGPALPTGNLRGSSADIAVGGDLFRLNCASCHGVTFRGAPLSAGKYAPSLYPSTDKQIYSAMLTGPESMPVFSDNEITPEQKRAIVAYIQNIKASKDPGGEGIGRIGPVSEAVVIWVAGVGFIMIAILWIGAKSQ